LDNTSHGEPILRRYLNGALRTAFVLQRLFESGQFECVASFHGIYVPEGIVAEVARERGVRVVNWTVAYRSQTFIFSHHDTYHHTLMSEPAETWESLAWTPEMQSEIMGYLKSRFYGTRDWLRVTQLPTEDLSAIAAEIGVDFSKPCVALLTNVIWDAQVHYPRNAFPNMVEWVLETIRYFAGRPELQLIIRIHPGELLGNPSSRQTVFDEIKRAFPDLPKNVFVILPESPISTYVAALQCNAVLIYGTKAGVELTSMGLPVIVAGEAWIRNKGLTSDANTPEEYFELLDRLPLNDRLNDAMVLRACRYAFHFFFRRMIPLTFMSTDFGPTAQPRLSSISELLPGQSKGLDVICRGIIDGAPFVYPAELDMTSIQGDAKAAGLYEGPVTEEARARGGLRILDILSRLGETERLRAHLLRALKEFPLLASESWAAPSIARYVRQLALASDSPLATVRFFRDRLREAARTIGAKNHFRTKRLAADIWMETSIGLVKRGSYRLAGLAAARSMVHDPTRVVRRIVFQR
jgi:hypothetical protein